MRDAVFLGDLGGGVLVAADERGHLHLGNALERVEVFLPERALARHADPHARLLRTACLARAAARFSFTGALRTAFFRFSRMMWPTAVFDAGTV